MNGEDIFDGITDARDDQIMQAERPHKRKRRFRPWMGAVAAAVAVAVGIGVVFGSGGLTLNAYAISEAKYPDRAKYSENDSKREKWRDERAERISHAGSYDGALDSFLTAAVPELLSGAGDGNAVVSPLNVYMALSMLAEVTGGGTRQQILALLGCDSIETCRERAKALWDVNYVDDGTVTSLLANSVWLSEEMEYEKDVLDTLAQDYRASSFRGEMGSDGYSRALREWINDNTGGRLSDAAEGLGFEPDTVLALASTVYYRARWSSEFSEGANTTGDFHAPSGDVTATYMHESMMLTSYCQGQGFSAVSKSMRYGGEMWFILPDEGVGVGELLSDAAFAGFLACPGIWENTRLLHVNLTVPKFDVAGSSDLIERLRALGVTDAFDRELADFSPMLGGYPAFVSSASHAARVTVDEEGVEAAAFTDFGTGSGSPQDEVIDFVLDRPFLFVLTGDDGLPLFVGVVNNP